MMTLAEEPRRQSYINVELIPTPSPLCRKYFACFPSKRCPYHSEDKPVAMEVRQVFTGSQTTPSHCKKRRLSLLQGNKRSPFLSCGFIVHKCFLQKACVVVWKPGRCHAGALQGCRPVLGAFNKARKLIHPLPLLNEKVADFFSFTNWSTNINLHYFSTHLGRQRERHWHAESVKIGEVLFR